ncbi:MAG: flavin reductase family protein [Pyrinomonadaceae bacterium]
MITDSEFRNAMARLAGGVTVVTTRDLAGRPHGLTVTAFTSLSAEPPLVLFCIHKQTYSHYAFFERQAFVVSILAEDQEEISRQFADPDVDKFVRVELVETAIGLPGIAGSLAVLECRVVQHYDGGDHTIVIGELDRVQLGEGSPLVYFRGEYRRLAD